MITKEKKIDIHIATRWYREVDWMLSVLQGEQKLYFSDEDLRSFGIYLADLNLEEPRPSGSESLFFDPVPEHKMPETSCTCKDPLEVISNKKICKMLSKNEDPQYTSRLLRNVVLLHEYTFESVRPSKWMAVNFDKEYTEASKWTVDCPDRSFHLFGASIPVDTRKPHLILRLLSNCTGDERMTRSEIIVLLNFIYYGIKRQISEYRKKWEKGEATELHAMIPILLVSVVSPGRVRIIQCLFDGMLKIKRSKLYDFNALKHDKLMETLIRWTKSRACGSTVVNKKLKSIPEGNEVEGVTKLVK